MKHVEEKIDKFIYEILTSKSNYTTFKELLNEQLDFLHSDEEILYFLHHIPSNKSFYNITRIADVFYTHFEDLKKLNQYIANLLPKLEGKIKKDNENTKILKGFKSNLTEPEITILYEAMQNNFFQTTLENLKAFLMGKSLHNVNIKWIDKGITRHEPNKQTIFEFIYLLKEYKHIPNDEFDYTPTNQNNLYNRLRAVFSDIKNFSNSNTTGKPNKNTARKKELETIIKSLQS